VHCKPLNVLPFFRTLRQAPSSKVSGFEMSYRMRKMAACSEPSLGEDLQWWQILLQTLNKSILLFYAQIVWKKLKNMIGAQIHRPRHTITFVPEKNS
jgi:hypothetical protein